MLGTIDDAEGPGGVADEGLDQPGPEVEEDCGAVSFAATRREWDAEGGTVGLAGRFEVMDYIDHINVSNSQAVLPDLATAELGEGWHEPDADEFFSRNILLILTARNRFGCD
jgi:hypothetical protein